MLRKLAMLLLVMSSLSAYADLAKDYQKRCEGREDSCRILISYEKTMFQKLSCSGNFLGATPCSFKFEKDTTYLSCGNNPFTRIDQAIPSEINEYKVSTILTDDDNNVNVTTDENSYVLISNGLMSILVAKTSNGNIQDSRIQVAIMGGNLIDLTDVKCE